MNQKPVRIEERPSFLLAGISTVTTNAAELSGAGKIGKLYERFYANRIEAQLGAHILSPGLYGCYFNYEQGHLGTYEVMVGVHVGESMPIIHVESVKTFVVPAAKYAVFVTERGPVIEAVQRTWGEIWQWSQQPGNERIFTGDFEYYGSNVDPDDGQVEIYIAIR
ncbi:Predicted transcriptional regulator YdeE, contains AraC-type DNA-binding domain [Cohnella sp. OV330]|uniref:GyrI-like domain-containing protein n=1 Tax=Cohnella sp. OV330 TaxID=1855288 RepID=UPI0008F2627D|nr:GyrI-like domain-containing protein [Cohnella sp. OV330]SFB49831.1 Predicted transcriptional regulator YdeE, contains AraC-type DNA-binding domain [Cohnella sp. OV330]